MTEPANCQYGDPATQHVCGNEVRMPTMFADSTFGPYLCSEHIKRVNDDRDELRARVPDGWETIEGSGGPAIMLKRLDGHGETVVWDPLGGVSVDAFLAALR